MSDALDALLADLHDAGHDAVTRAGDREEASGRVRLGPVDCREPPTGWRGLLPRVHCDAGDPELVPDDLRATVEAHGFTVQAMGRNDTTATVVVSRNGV